MLAAISALVVLLKRGKSPPSRWVEGKLRNGLIALHLFLPFALLGSPLSQLLVLDTDTSCRKRGSL